MMGKRTGNGCTHFLHHPTPARLQEINFPLIPSEKLPSLMLQHSLHPQLPWSQTGGQGDTEVTHGHQAQRDEVSGAGKPEPCLEQSCELLELPGQLNQLCSHLAQLQPWESQGWLLLPSQKARPGGRKRGGEGGQPKPAKRQQPQGTLSRQDGPTGSSANVPRGCGQLIDPWAGSSIQHRAPAGTERL